MQQVTEANIIRFSEQMLDTTYNTSVTWFVHPQVVYHLRRAGRRLTNHCRTDLKYHSKGYRRHLRQLRTLRNKESHSCPSLVNVSSPVSHSSEQPPSSSPVPLLS